LQLIDVVNFRWSDAFVIAINSSLDKSGTVMSFEALDYALVVGLNMCSEIWHKVLNSNILKAVGNNVARKVVLKKKDFASLCLQFLIPLLNPILIEKGHHPCLWIAFVIKPKLSISLLVECLWMCCFSDNKRWKLLEPTRI
jgi:hypothetical protein